MIKAVIALSRVTALVTWEVTLAVVMVGLPQLAKEALFQLFPTGERTKDVPIPYTASPDPSQKKANLSNV